MTDPQQASDDPPGSDDPSPSLSPTAPATAGPAPTDEPQLTSRRGRRGLAMALVAASVALILGVAAPPFVRDGLSRWHADRATSHYVAGDLDAALAALDRAIELSPENPRRYYERGQMRFEADHWQESLADFDRLLELNPSFASGYASRAVVHSRLGQHAQAIADAHRYVEGRPAWDAEPLNLRAYTRALAGAELTEARDDIDRAIEIDARARSTAAEPADNPDYLDTRGYVAFRQGELDAALTDLHLAREVAVGLEKRDQALARQESWSDPRREFIERSHRRRLAVIHHHLALVYTALGEDEPATEHRHLADELGYTPEVPE